VKILSCHTFLIIKTLISLSLDPPHHYKTNKYHILSYNKIIPLPLHHYKINKHHILSHNNFFLSHSHSSYNPISHIIKKSTRSTKLPAYLKDFHCNIVVGIESKNSSLVKYPISSFVNYLKFSNNHNHLAFSISSIIEPTTYAQAVKHENWRKAMDDEINVLVQTGT